jgi:GTP-binding protein
VGKSTLFNHFTHKKSLVSPIPHTTRDRLYASLRLGEGRATMVDVGGWVNDGVGILQCAQKQLEVAVEEGDIFLLIVDGKAGLLPMDVELADWARRQARPTILVVNKVDNPKQYYLVNDFYKLGFSPVIALSALNRLGIGELRQAMVDMLPQLKAIGEVTPQDKPVAVAIVGRPNVGKSSILNYILGNERAVVHEEPGTTRDPIDELIRFHGQEILLVDTAGLRKRKKIARDKTSLEGDSVKGTLAVIRRSDVAILVLDATELIQAQDTKIAGYIDQEGKGCLVCVNKWDLVEKDTMSTVQFEERLRERLKFLSYAPVVFTSAKTGQRIGKLLELAVKIEENRCRSIPTPQLNRFIARFGGFSLHGRDFKIYYCSQTGVRPPTFKFFVNNTKQAHFSFQRFLENKFRQQFDFSGTPIRMHFRGRKRND